MIIRYIPSKWLYAKQIIIICACWNLYITYLIILKSMLQRAIEELNMKLELKAFKRWNSLLKPTFSGPPESRGSKIEVLCERRLNAATKICFFKTKVFGIKVLWNPVSWNVSGSPGSKNRNFFVREVCFH